MLRALLRSLLGTAPRNAATLIPDADLDPALPADMRGFLARANDAAGRGDLDAALDRLARARKTFPESPWPALVQALVEERRNRPEDAARRYTEAALLDAAGARTDSVAQHFYTRGLVHLGERRIPSARQCLELAHRLSPEASAPLGMLGYAGYFDGNIEASRRDYNRALAVARPHERGVLRINRMIDTLPQIFSSCAEVDESRRAFSQELDALLSAPPPVPDPLAAIHRTVFYLCYQGRNDREINSRLARLFLQSCPGLGRVAAHAAARGKPGAALARGLCLDVPDQAFGRRLV